MPSPQSGHDRGCCMMKIVEQGGASEEHVWGGRQGYWLPANPPGTMHADVKAGDKVMVVELEKEK
jgi:beta-alanine degradation protein BauB